MTANAGSTLGGIGTMGGPVTIASGATLDAGPAAGAVGTLTMGALTLNAGSQLTYDLGQANVIGGPNNDLVQVNGNLTLGGVVNVNAPGSSFANTLLARQLSADQLHRDAVGKRGHRQHPERLCGKPDPDRHPQPGQPHRRSEWRSHAVLGRRRHDRQRHLNGGTGSWNNGAGNWTNTTGAINQSWIPGVGIFTGAAGIVTIAEPVSAMGLQFITDGYQVTSAGSALTMVARPDGSMPFIRVDPGATVDIGARDCRHGRLAEGRCRHLDPVGANTYTGGTVIGGGTLQLGNGGTAGSIVGDVTNDGALVFDRSDVQNFTGVISGSGTVTQAGTGTTILTGANTYTGGTVISGGTLQLGNGGASGSIVGNIIDNGALVFDRSGALSMPGSSAGRER